MICIIGKRWMIVVPGVLCLDFFSPGTRCRVPLRYAGEESKNDIVCSRDPGNHYQFPKLKKIEPESVN